eukprot:6200340-Pyramimonas_sp.AAC.1
MSFVCGCCLPGMACLVRGALRVLLFVSSRWVACTACVVGDALHGDSGCWVHRLWLPPSPAAAARAVAP